MYLLTQANYKIDLRTEFGDSVEVVCAATDNSTVGCTDCLVGIQNGRSLSLLLQVSSKLSFKYEVVSTVDFIIDKCFSGSGDNTVIN